MTASDRAAAAQPLWALVPPRDRARYLRRAAKAVLDELDALADLLADEAGQPRSEAMLAELLPSIGGLHGLAGDGPEALADRRLGPVPALRAGRRSTLVQAPLGVVGVQVRDGSPWAGPLLEVAASLLAGNAVLLVPAAPRAAALMRDAFIRAGLPEELFQLVADEDLAGAEHTVALEPPPAKGTMLVLDGAPLDRAITGAVWAAFAGAGRRHASLGRVIALRTHAQALAAGIEGAARRLRVGDPARPDTEVGPLPGVAERDRVEALVAQAEAAGASRLCGGPVDVSGVAGAFYAPAVLRGVPPAAALLRELVPGPVLALVEAASEEDAIALARDTGGTLSIWTGDPARGELIARVLGADIAWINEHGVASPAAPVRLAKHVASRQLASQPTRLRSARWLPYDASLLRAATASARLRHGRESERWAVLRSGALPLARTAARLGREALSR
ncbi:MAG TPA: aldehyde dehydrogenase family protein [Solirubrobacteraceae bacterium]|nr:aldehyde dehydrogenase family protein [Solirubrobacteraceae bacterium]